MSRRTPRIILHAGFPKCASTSIQVALSQERQPLAERGIYCFDRNMNIDPATAVGMPIWHVEAARKTGALLSAQIAEVVADAPHGDLPTVPETLILSAENLAGRDCPRLFLGLDDIFEVEVRLYFRPQAAWIVSAWKQFEIPRGKPLTTFVENCLHSGEPNFFAKAKAWQSALPESRVRVTPLIPEVLLGGRPESDFFSSFGADDILPGTPLHENASFDHSILHVLRSNPHLMEGRDVNQTYSAIVDAVPAEYRSVNIRMLDQETIRHIERRYRGENIALLSTFGDMELTDAARFHDRHFVTPSVDGESYTTATDGGINARAAQILSATLGNLDPADPISGLLRDLATAASAGSEVPT
ncbi:hypothetical protein [Jannaschia rubra]|uniref:Uncharacterized protein n=2 Tax=Jannaschia rubra TaxID=282197 RepID=A0A0M6XNR4_9RHOB|nr:hypothetical protein [Jannaschia rubra]CTQ32729.1 hypothetical protein JAN5088_01501 [Jannaschia rubra]SFF88392.1 hypothetical protein SAMN04488517_101664 [Jannaschia rubra]